MSRKSRRFAVIADDLMGWWAETIIRGFDPMCPGCKAVQGKCESCARFVDPELNAAVIAEWERRGKPGPRNPGIKGKK